VDAADELALLGGRSEPDFPEAGLVAFRNMPENVGEPPIERGLEPMAWKRAGGTLEIEKL
jgi:hypothetical protein